VQSVAGDKGNEASKSRRREEKEKKLAFRTREKSMTNVRSKKSA
jgi:hypothetical protein